MLRADKQNVHKTVNIYSGYKIVKQIVCVNTVKIKFLSKCDMIKV